MLRRIQLLPMRTDPPFAVPANDSSALIIWDTQIRWICPRRGLPRVALTKTGSADERICIGDSERRYPAAPSRL
jgi:hypothetical protein